MKCSIFGCDTNLDDPNVVSYPFPSQYDLCAQWVSIAAREEGWWVNTDGPSRVCARHFACPPADGDIPTLELPAQDWKVSNPQRSQSHPVYRMQYPQWTMVLVAQQLMKFPNIFSDDKALSAVALSRLGGSMPHAAQVHDLLTFSKLWLLREWRKHLAPFAIQPDGVSRARAAATNWMLFADDKLQLVDYIMQNDYMGKYKEILRDLATLVSSGKAPLLATTIAIKYNIAEENVLDMWATTRCLIRMKLQCLVNVGDIPSRLPRAARIGPHDCDVTPAAILEDDVATWTVIYSESWLGRPILFLILIARMYSIGDLDVPPEVHRDRWVIVYHEYIKSGVWCPFIVLQRRWHQLLEDTRRAFTHSPTSPKGRPHVFHLLVAARWPNVVTGTLPSWQEMKEKGFVHKLTDRELQELPPSRHKLPDDRNELFDTILKTVKLDEPPPDTGQKPDTGRKPYTKRKPDIRKKPDNAESSDSDDQLYIDIGEISKNKKSKTNPPQKSKTRPPQKSKPHPPQKSKPHPPQKPKPHPPQKSKTHPPQKPKPHPPQKSKKVTEIPNQSISYFMANEQDSLLNTKDVETKTIKELESIDPSKAETTIFFESDDENDDKQKVLKEIEEIQMKMNSKNDDIEMEVRYPLQTRDDTIVENIKNESCTDEKKAEFDSNKIANLTTDLLMDLDMVKKEKDSNVVDVVKKEIDSNIEPVVSKSRTRLMFEDDSSDSSEPDDNFENSDTSQNSSNNDVIVDEKLVMETRVVLEKVDNSREWKPTDHGTWRPRPQQTPVVPQQKPVEDVPKIQSDCTTDAIKSYSSKLISEIESGTTDTIQSYSSKLISEIESESQKQFTQEIKPQIVTENLQSESNPIHNISSNNQSDSDLKQNNDSLKSNQLEISDLTNSSQNMFENSKMVSESSQNMSVLSKFISESNTFLRQSNSSLYFTSSYTLVGKTEELLRLCKPVTVQLQRLQTPLKTEKTNDVAWWGDAPSRPVSLPRPGPARKRPVAEVKPLIMDANTYDGVCSPQQLENMIQNELKLRVSTVARGCCLSRNLLLTTDARQSFAIRNGLTLPQPHSAHLQHTQLHPMRCDCCCRWLLRDCPPPKGALFYLRHKLIRMFKSIIDGENNKDGKSICSELFDELELMSSDEEVETPTPRKRPPPPQFRTGNKKIRSSAKRKKPRIRNRTKIVATEEITVETEKTNEKIPITDYDEWLRQRNDFKKYFTIKSVIGKKKPIEKPETNNQNQDKPTNEKPESDNQSQDKPTNEPNTIVTNNPLLVIANSLEQAKKMAEDAVKKALNDANVLQKGQDTNTSTVVPLTKENLALHTKIHDQTTNNSNNTRNVLPTVQNVTNNTPPVLQNYLNVAQQPQSIIISTPTKGNNSNYSNVLYIGHNKAPLNPAGQHTRNRSGRNIVGQVGQNIVSQVGQNVVSQMGQTLVPQAGQNVVNQIGQNIMSQSQFGQNVVIQVDRNILNQVRQNTVSQMGQTVVSQVGQNIVSQTRQNIVSQVGQNIVNLGQQNLVNQVGQNISQVGQNVMTQVGQKVMTQVGQNFMTRVGQNVMTQVGQNILSGVPQTANMPVTLQNNSQNMLLMGQNYVPGQPNSLMPIFPQANTLEQVRNMAEDAVIKALNNTNVLQKGQNTVPQIGQNQNNPTIANYNFPIILQYNNVSVNQNNVNNQIVIKNSNQVQNNIVQQNVSTSKSLLKPTVREQNIVKVKPKVVKLLTGCKQVEIELEPVGQTEKEVINKYNIRKIVQNDKNKISPKNPSIQKPKRTNIFKMESILKPIPKEVKFVRKETPNVSEPIKIISKPNVVQSKPNETITKFETERFIVKTSDVKRNLNRNMSLLRPKIDTERVVDLTEDVIETVIQDTDFEGTQVQKPTISQKVGNNLCTNTPVNTRNDDDVHDTDIGGDKDVGDTNNDMGDTDNDMGDTNKDVGNTNIDGDNDMGDTGDTSNDRRDIDNDTRGAINFIDVRNIDGDYVPKILPRENVAQIDPNVVELSSGDDDDDVPLSHLSVPPVLAKFNIRRHYRPKSPQPYHWPHY